LDSNSVVAQRHRTALAWPFVGLVLGALFAINPFGAPRVAFSIGVLGWCVDLLLVLALSANPLSARFGSVLSGLFLALPCLVTASPLSRVLLMCFYAVPFVFAAAMLLAPPIPGAAARLAYLFSWFSTRPIERSQERFDAAAFRNLLLAALILALALAIIRSTTATGIEIPLRWLAGGLAMLAVAEIATTSLALVSAALGIVVPPLFQSPYRARSVSEYWTRHWNIPTSEIFRRFLFAPLARRSQVLALSATFAVSGVAHAMLVYMVLGKPGISLMCGAFFFVQPFFILAERWLGIRRWRPWVRHTWTIAVFIIASPLVVEPVLQIIERSWTEPRNVPLTALATIAFVVAVSAVLALASLATMRQANENLAA
jgi:Membrane bound O-acyl transferase family